MRGRSWRRRRKRRRSWRRRRRRRGAALLSLNPPFWILPNPPFWILPNFLLPGWIRGAPSQDGGEQSSKKINLESHLANEKSYARNVRLDVELTAY